METAYTHKFVDHLFLGPLTRFSFFFDHEMHRMRFLPLPTAFSLPPLLIRRFLLNPGRRWNWKILWHRGGEASQISQDYVRHGIPRCAACLGETSVPAGR